MCPDGIPPGYIASSTVNCHYSFMHENLLDMNHQFLHRGVIGKIQPKLTPNRTSPPDRGQAYRSGLSRCETRPRCSYARIEAPSRGPEAGNEELWPGQTKHRSRCLG
ncbi:MAG: hypothetical protein ACRDPY_20310 [Streptosporangiaceae bacterium]